MRGRYRRTATEEEFARIYQIPFPFQAGPPTSWNIAPFQSVLAIRKNPENGQRCLDALRWGLVPSWSKDDKIGHRTITARFETVDTLPSCRSAFRKRRCLIAATGFYEWQGSGKGKRPYSIGMKDDSPFVFAGLWEGWKLPGSEQCLYTCTIITCEPNELCAEIQAGCPSYCQRNIRRLG